MGGEKVYGLLFIVADNQNFFLTNFLYFQPSLKVKKKEKNENENLKAGTKQHVKERDSGRERK